MVSLLSIKCVVATLLEKDEPQALSSLSNTAAWLSYLRKMQGWGGYVSHRYSSTALPICVLVSISIGDKTHAVCEMYRHE